VSWQRWILGLASPGGARGRLSIFTYHRVLAHADPLLPGEPTLDDFARQIEWLREHFCVLPLPEAAERLRTGSLPRRAACVTFDDGYENNVTLALPVLVRLRVPASFFVATGYVGGGRMWNDTVIEAIRGAAPGEIDLQWLELGRAVVNGVEERRTLIERVLGSLKYLEAGSRRTRAEELAERILQRPLPRLMMTVEQVRELDAAGMDVGAHTCSHPILSRSDDLVAQREIGDSRAQLQDWLGHAPVSFAYPNGRPGVDYAPRHVMMVRDAGFQVGVSTAWASARTGADPMQLPRLSPMGMGSARFVARIARSCH
jgi:peptidoglycan/xylan/chitin deacetylase (PgdA/CDA1 family)